MSGKESVARRAALAMTGAALAWQWLPRLGAWLAVSAAGAVLAQDADPEVLVRLHATDDQTLRRYLMKNRKRIEVLRYTPANEPGTAVSALVLMRRSATRRERLPDRINVERLAEPPRSASQVPQVGRGNRFADPAAQPQRRGELIR